MGHLQEGVVDRGDVAFRHMKVDTLTILSTCVEKKSPREHMIKFGEKGG